jgi:hypothetical protein
LPTLIFTAISHKQRPILGIFNDHSGSLAQTPVSMEEPQQSVRIEQDGHGKPRCYM